MGLFDGIRKKDVAVVSFETILLRESGMRFTAEYEIVMKDGNAEITEYSIRYLQKEDKRIPEKRTVCSEEAVLKLMNEYRVISWDGFSGAHPKGVSDGIMFTFRATVNGGKRIYATGSQNFPKNYREFRNGLNSLLNGTENG